MRTVTGPTDRVVIVGAGLGGLACALHLVAAGRDVTVLERARVPGGSAGRLSVEGFEFDTGPTVLTAPELIAQPFAAVGEDLTDWLAFTRLDPAYRAFFPDGSRLDVISDPDRMAEQVAAVCGPREATGYRRFVEFATALWRLQRDDFIARDYDSPLDALRPNLWHLVRSGAFRSLQGKVDSYFRDPRMRRIFSFQSLYAGVAPHRALALYAVISYLDTVRGVYLPQGGVHAVPAALAAAATKHGVTIRYDTTVTRVETHAGRARAIHTRAGERIPADVVVLNPDLPVAHRTLLPAVAPPRRLRHLRQSPSALVLHIGSDQAYGQIAHHNLHFGRSWAATFDDITRRGRLMRDPSLLVSNPSRTDPSLAPAGRHTYYVLAPVPNLATGPSAAAWRERGLAQRYADQIIATLEARGYVGLGSSVRTRLVASPANWAALGHAAGTPFASAHLARQTGPFRPGTLHPSLANVVFVGAGTRPGVGVPMVLLSGRLAAQRVTGS